MKKEKPVKNTEKKQLEPEENERVQKSRRGWMVNSVKHYRGPRNEIHEEPLAALVRESCESLERSSSREQLQQKPDNMGLRENGNDLPSKMVN